MTEMPQPTKTEQTHFYHKFLASLEVNGEEIPCVSFKITATLDSINFELRTDKDVTITDITRWKVRVGNFVYKGKGKNPIASGLYFATAPSLAPDMLTAIPCQGVIITHSEDGKDTLEIIQPLVAA